MILKVDLLSLAFYFELQEDNRVGTFQKILLVEDCIEVQVLVRATLGKRYNLTVSSNFLSASKVIDDQLFDLAIIDIGLPDGDGFQLCSYLKQTRNQDTPVIFLTSRGDIRDKILGFSIGAQDYIVKPFEPLELSARVDSKLHFISTKRDEIQKGAIRISVPLQKAFVSAKGNERDLGLSPNEFRLLYYFMNHEDHVLSRAQLLDAVWGREKSVTDRTIDSHVYTLRKKLIPYSEAIESIFGTGYRFSTKRMTLTDSALSPCEPSFEL